MVQRGERRLNIIVCELNQRNMADEILNEKRKVMGESIRELRTAQGWTQEQLAEIAGITTANLERIEAGKYAVSLDILNKIAGALNAELRIVEV